MYTSAIGAFDGDSWEALCQLVFKKKYAAEGYQHMNASPGDFGIEGFTMLTGYAFQCYCPEKHYSGADLYEKQRNKITIDLSKLKKYEAEIAKRINGTKIDHWVFVTPEIDKNDLHKHARTKEVEVRDWGLGILGTEFRIHLRDADFYQIDINEIRAAAGEALHFDTAPPALPVLDGPPEQYEGNVKRKTERRLASKASHAGYERLVTKLHQQTLRSFLEADSFLRKIEETAPTLYFRVLRIINEYENEVKELSVAAMESPEALTMHVKDGLAKRLAKDLSPTFDETSANKVARYMVARWLAICELDYE